MTIGQTILLGIVGSFVGGFLGWALFGADLDEGAFQASGIFGSIIGAIVVLLLWRAVPGGRRRRTSSASAAGTAAVAASDSAEH